MITKNNSFIKKRRKKITTFLLFTQALRKDNSTGELKRFFRKATRNEL